MKKKSDVLKRLAAGLDVFLLLAGMAFLSIGVFKIYIPAGYLTIGVCLVATAFFVAKKQADGGGS